MTRNPNMRLEVHEKILANDAQLSTDDAIFCPMESATTEDRIQMALELERELASRDRVKNVPYNGVQDGVGERHVFSTDTIDARQPQHSDQQPPSGATGRCLCASWLWQLSPAWSISGIGVIDGAVQQQAGRSQG